MTTINREYDINHRSGLTVNLILPGLYPYFFWMFNATDVKFTIDDNMNILAVQKDFSKLFPYLRLEFYMQPHHENGASSKKLIPVTTAFREFRKSLGSDRISINAAMTINDLEKNFRNQYGII